MPVPESSNQFRIEVSADAELTRNIQPLLHEIRHALKRLLQYGEPHIIDLRRIPLAPGEEERILELLGSGEVEVTLDTTGSSRIFETRFSGVWLITHFNEDNEVIGRFIEITKIPDIVSSQTEDMLLASRRLDETLETRPLTEEET